MRCYAIRTLITIGELAKLLNISTHQIRYFEEKKIFSPNIIDENGYRLYDIKQVYQLEHILLLRKFNIPVSQIRKSLKDYSHQEYVHMMQENLFDINKQIDHLVHLKNLSLEVLDKISALESSLEKYRINDLNERFMKLIYHVNQADFVSTKTFYDNALEKIKNPTLFDTDITYICDDDSLHVCTTFLKPSVADYLLEAGQYLCFGFFADDYTHVQSQVLSFLNYINDNKISTRGKLIISESSLLSIFNNGQIYYEIQILTHNKDASSRSLVLQD